MSTVNVLKRGCLLTPLVILCEIRIERLHEREHERYGERIMLGGYMYAKSQAFLE
jgi:hypothetical protein